MASHLWLAGTAVIMALVKSSAAQACGGNLTTQGTLTSPNYPGLYPNEVTCIWNLQASVNKILFLEVLALNLETGKDRLKVYNGSLAAVPTITYTGNLTYIALTLARDAKLVFTSDATGRMKGFSIRFTSIASASSATTSPTTVKATTQIRTTTGTPSTSPTLTTSRTQTTTVTPSTSRTSTTSRTQTTTVTPSTSRTSTTSRAQITTVMPSTSRTSTTSRAQITTVTPSTSRTSTTSRAQAATTTGTSSTSRTPVTAATPSTSGTLTTSRPPTTAGTPSTSRTLITSMTTTATRTPTTTAAPATTYTQNATTTAAFSSCGGNLTGQGNLTSPNYPAQYPNNAFCTWRLTASPNRSVAMEIVAFNIEQGYDYLSVFTENQTDMMYTPFRYTGNMFYTTLQFGKTVTVVFTSDSSVQMSGFHLRFTSVVPTNQSLPPTTVQPTPYTTSSSPASACGGNLTDQGAFTAPQVLWFYPYGLSCSWQLRASPNKVIQLVIEELALDGASEYLTVYNPVYNQPPSFYYSYSGRLTYTVLQLSQVATVSYYSGYFAPTSRFRIRFTSVSGPNQTAPLLSAFNTTIQQPFSPTASYALACGGNLSDHGNLTSPNYPAAYAHSGSCMWQLDAGPNKVIQLEISNYSLNSADGSLSVYPPNYNSKPYFYYSYSGALGYTVLQLGRAATVWYYSDGSLHKDGFRIQFTSVQAPNQSLPSPEYSTPTSPPSTPTYYSNECGGNLTDQGNLTSPNYPAPYPSNAYCTWRLTASPNRSVAIEIVAFNLEQGYDYLSVFVENQTGLLSTPFRYSGNMSYTTLQFGKAVTVVFTSDYIIQMSGFYLRFTSVVPTNQSLPPTTVQPPPYTTNPSPAPACGGNLTDQGNLTSPNYPAPYPSNAYCTWRLTASPNRSVAIEIVDFNIEQSYDYLSVYIENQTGLLYTPFIYTGSMPYTTLQFGKAVTVVFTSDYIVQMSGFYLRFTSVVPTNQSLPPITVQPPPYTTSPSPAPVCGGNLTDQSTINAPQNLWLYPYGLSCVWQLEASPNKVIQLVIEELALDGVSEYLSIYNPAYNQLPNFYYSYSGRLTYTVLQLSRVAIVSYYSGYFALGSGFRIHFTSVSGPNQTTPLPPAFNATSQQPVSPTASNTIACGGNLSDHGNLTSPNYPAAYAHSGSCVWQLNAGPNKVIQLEINNFSLNSADGYLSVYSLNYFSKPYFYYSYSGALEYTVLQLGPAATVSYYSDGSHHKDGFRIQFTSVQAPNQSSPSPEYSTTPTNLPSSPADYSKSCGGNLTGQGNLTSPNYPALYPNYAYCTWRLTASPNKSVAIEIVAFNIERGYDFVSLFMEDQTGLLYTPFRYTGEMFNTALQFGRTVTVVFTSDGSVQGSGFHLRFTSVVPTNQSLPPTSVQPPSYTTPSPVPACGRNLTEQGNVTSPNYPGLYPNNAYCLWQLRASPSKILQLEIAAFNLEPNFDTVLIYPEDYTQGPYYFYTYTGFVGNTILSLGQAATLVFSTDSSVQMSGFSIRFTSVAPFNQYSTWSSGNRTTTQLTPTQMVTNNG